jgi:hypothetical protein
VKMMFDDLNFFLRRFFKSIISQRSMFPSRENIIIMISKVVHITVMFSKIKDLNFLFYFKFIQKILHSLT